MIVQEVVGEAAKAAGVKAGDIILTIDGRPMKAPNELQAYIASKHPGDKVKLVLWRDEKKLEKEITLKPRTQTSSVASNDGDEEENGSVEPSSMNKAIDIEKLGFSVRKADSRTLEDRDLKSGVLVSSVKNFSEGATRGLREGDVIIDVDKKPVATTGELEKILKAKKGGDAVLMRVKGADSKIRFIAVMMPKG